MDDWRTKMDHPFRVAMMEADEKFQKDGAAGTKTYIRDYLFPVMVNIGIMVAKCDCLIKTELLELLKKSYCELNAIKARDGVPYCYDGRKSDVDEECFAELVDDIRAAIAKAEGR